MESPIWNILIQSHPELPYDIDDSDDNDNDDEYDDLSPVPVESKVINCVVTLSLFNFLVQHHENIEPTKSNTIKYVSFGFVWIDFTLV